MIIDSDVDADCEVFWFNFRRRNADTNFHFGGLDGRARRRLHGQQQRHRDQSAEVGNDKNRRQSEAEKDCQS